MAMLRQDIERIESLAAQVKAEREGTVGDLLSKLKNINAELDTSWEGPSQEAFYASYGGWIDQLEKFSNTLHNIHQYLVSVATNFRDLDEAARAAASGATVPQ